MTTNCTETAFFRKIFYCGNDDASTAASTWGTFAAAVAVSVASLGGQALAFIVIRWRLSRIYRPRSYLVPERERVPPPPSGIFGWLVPLWSTSNLVLIQKCGLDAYFFLRFLRVQLKIFLPAAFLLLPVLLPINSTGGNGITGLSRLSISNVSPAHANRLWAHLLAALLFIGWVLYVVFTEFTGYIRIRQAYLTSPQHRIRASATTVLISGIPAKWLSLEALSGLYDVYPGGIRNIWINRNYDDLASKVKYRGQLAKSLEDAETNLIKQCRTRNAEAEKKQAKRDGRAAGTSAEKKQDKANENALAEHMAEGHGTSAGAQLEVHHGGDDILHDSPAPAIVSTLDSQNAPMSPFEIEEPRHHQIPDLARRPWLVFRNNDNSIAVPSPQPHVAEDDEYPLRSPKPKADNKKKDKKKDKQKDKKTEEVYPCAFAQEWDEDQDGEPYWRRYLKPEDRETMRVPIFNPTWCPSIPFVGKKVDRIYWLRRELARLNLEIETDQGDITKYPYMNSAFIQFNNQIAAHMCCQSLSHHIPQQMAPRAVEISPDDVIWDNMAIKWWERYLRTGVVLVICAGLIVFYAVPVAITGLVSNLSKLAAYVPWLNWLATAPSSVQSIITGVVPPLLLVIILLLVPIIFRLLVQQQGVATGNAKEQGVQVWYYAFLFIQVFLVVTISNGFGTFVSTVAKNPSAIVSSLATSLPSAANYFFSYLVVQALSQSASGLLQTGALFTWFVMAPLSDSTARAKWRRQTELQKVQWGSFFPPFANFATIGIIYSILSPLIVVNMLLIYGLFSIVYRYNVLFVYQFRNDTGGLLFPVALNQLFVGLYFLEICLIGIFFAKEDSNHKAACIPQGVIMSFALAGTALYQWLLNESFRPLFQYLPITLEDEAVIRDEQFAKAQTSKFAPLRASEEDESPPIQKRQEDPESQQTVGDVLYAGIANELEDLTPEERDTLVRYAFQHEALRAKRPVIWIPRDTLGVSDDEIKRAQKMSTVKIKGDDGVENTKTNIWMSNQGTALDSKGRVVFRKSPPDFRSADLISL